MDSRVLIVDDHPIIRMSVNLHLRSQGFDIVGEAGDGVEAMRLITRFKPDILILDIGIPKIDGLTLLRQIRVLKLPIKVIIFSGQGPTQLAIHCIKNGAHGFVHKQSALTELVAAMKAETPGYDLPADLAYETNSDTECDQKILATLSAREFAILPYLAQGVSIKEIAEKMLLSQKTVSTYKTRLLNKLNMNTVIDLFKLAKRNNLI